MRIFGGEKNLVGALDFDQYLLGLPGNHELPKWEKTVTYTDNPKGIKMPIGAKFVRVKHKQTDNLYLFSGQVPMLKTKGRGVRMCPTDLFKLSIDSNHYEQVEYVKNKRLVGRKNYAVSTVKDLIFISGGCLGNSEMISDFIMFNTT